MRHFKKYIKKYGFLFSIAIIFLMIEAICDLLLPTILASIIDNGVADGNLQYVLNMGGLMLLVTGIGALGAIIRNIISSNLSQRLGAELRSDLYRKVQSFRLEEMNQFEASSLVTRLTNDVNQMQMFVNGLMRIMVKAPLVCIGSIFMAVRLNASISWVLLIVIPIVALIILLNVRISLPFFMRVQKATDKLNGVVREYLSGIRVIRAFNRGRFEQSRFDEKNEQLFGTSTKAMRVMSIFSPGISLTVNFGIVLVLLAGGWNINDGQMQVGEVVAYVNYMTQILISLMMITMIFNMFVRARVSAGRISEVLGTDNPAEIKGLKTSIPQEGVVFEQVHFSYHGTKEYVLKDVSLSLKPGETIGIIGSTGAGKSSLVNLLLRLYEPSHGAIYINGENIQTMDLKQLRNQIAYVPQKSMLFTGTIKENILWGKADASMEDIRHAANIAQADAFISRLPEGYDTQLGQGGVNLSGGQKQRVSIARALLKEAPILVLDDSTSALDAVTEQRLKEALSENRERRIVFLIAQRITSIMDADHIIVMENGHVAGAGTHEELAKNNSVYKEIILSQLGTEMETSG
ncbi:ABC transporter ATP-binding protein [Pradoshia sp.]|uniref:ABC transporter ATP-binding protein n=1 Tax=Pradoshia sp. TaxID=2651281 RepID=UPI003EFC24FC